MNVLSLFDGISTGRLALERAGIKVDKYYASEIDTRAIKISKANWDDVVQLGDVNGIDVDTLPKIDLLIGGSPCQGFSRAGKGLNFKDPRSRLFFKFVEILEALRVKNPDIKFLLENVNMAHEWRDIITEYLGVEPVLIDSKKNVCRHARACLLDKYLEDKAAKRQRRQAAGRARHRRENRGADRTRGHPF